MKTVKILKNVMKELRDVVLSAELNEVAEEPAAPIEEVLVESEESSDAPEETPAGWKPFTAVWAETLQKILPIWSSGPVL